MHAVLLAQIAHMNTALVLIPLQTRHVALHAITNTDVISRPDFLAFAAGKALPSKEHSDVTFSR